MYLRTQLRGSAGVKMRWRLWEISVSVEWDETEWGEVGRGGGGGVPELGLEEERFEERCFERRLSLRGFGSLGGNDDSGFT